MNLPHRYRLIIGYDGTDFHGWQHNEGFRTVQGELTQAAGVIVGGPVEVEGSSRTDAGVHALGHLVRIRLATEVDVYRFQHSLQGVSPRDIEVIDCVEAVSDWHPRFHAIGKRYLYRIWNSPRRPLFGERTCWWVRPELDCEKMQQASEGLIGRHDFAAYRSRSKQDRDDTVRTLHQISVLRHGSSVSIQVVGDGFLYRMVRNLVGVLVEVGRGLRDVDDPTRILASTDRQQAGFAAPAPGLFLMEVACRGEPIPQCLELPMTL
ncbi:MAG TPA: tRNA pseudouridine(38-40) synthase TruA [Planctomycetes bacterium]|nr:tRNA pseudouridine(38-40) synthase TruA [Planctomycetota bacterium]HIK83394.1 tRNA pseudouridine(38-40) synthase TruA [Planctomycetota bacterium]